MVGKCLLTLDLFTIFTSTYTVQAFRQNTELSQANHSKNVVFAVSEYTSRGSCSDAGFALIAKQNEKTVAEFKY